MSNVKRFLIIGAAFSITTVQALAVEYAMGRTLPGVWIQPQVGVVGPESAFSFTAMPLGYMGAIGGGRLVPIGGSIFANVDANVSGNYLVPEYVYKTETPKVSFASSAMVPIFWVGATGCFVGAPGSLVGAPPCPVGAPGFLVVRPGSLPPSASSNGGVGDLVTLPLTVGIHFSENNNLAVSTWIFAPTGQWRQANLSNLGMGEWTVMPNIAHTYLWKKRGLEFDNFIGFDIYTQNSTTKYKSGTMFHWDGMVIYHLSERVGFGVIGSNLTQITNDSGALIAELLHGFEGRAWGVGPMALYVAKVEKPGVFLQLRWINEFKVTNLLKGNTLMLGVTLKFK
jgi:hypothetical protein